MRFKFYVLGTRRSCANVIHELCWEFVNVRREDFVAIGQPEHLDVLRGWRFGYDTVLVITDDPDTRGGEAILEVLIDMDQDTDHKALWLWCSDGSFHLSVDELHEKFSIQEIRYRAWEDHRSRARNITVVNPGYTGGIAHYSFDVDGSTIQYAPALNRMMRGPVLFDYNEASPLSLPGGDMISTIQWELGTALHERLLGQLLTGEEPDVED